MDAPDADDSERIAAMARRLRMTRPAVVPLVGGSRNRCYRLTAGAQDVVLRIAGANDAAYAVARDAESLAQRLAAAHGLAPRLLLEDCDAGVSVMEYLQGPTWSRELAASPAGAARVGAWLARLHAIPVPPALRRVDFLESLEGYLRQLGPTAAGERCLAEAKRRSLRLVRTPCGAFCHNDLHHLNLLETARGLMAVDWEYAGVGDAVLDLAGYMAYHDLEAGAVGHLLAAYGSGARPPEPGEIDEARWLFEAVWWAWLELKRAIDGDEPGDARRTRCRLEARLDLYAA